MKFNTGIRGSFLSFGAPLLFALLFAASARSQVTTLGNSGVNAQVGTSYTIALSDSVKLLTFSNAAPVAVTLPAASTFGAGVVFQVKNMGAGLVTITPGSGTIDGNANLPVGQGEGFWLYNDGANYFTNVSSAATMQGAKVFNSPVTINALSSHTAGGNLQGSWASGPTFTITSSPTGAVEAGNIVTITTSTVCNFVALQSVNITGVGVAGYNGGFVVIAPCSGGTTFTYFNPAGGLAGSGGGSAIGSPIFTQGLTHTGPETVSGPLTMTNHNQIFWAGPGPTPTIDQAIANCQPFPTPCFVTISPQYTGAESANLFTTSMGYKVYNGANNVTVEDLRANPGAWVTTAASVNGSNVATLTFGGTASLPGFSNGMAVIIYGFTGADTYFNVSATLTTVVGNVVTFPLTHATASATSNGVMMAPVAAPLYPIIYGGRVDGELTRLGTMYYSHNAIDSSAATTPIMFVDGTLPANGGLQAASVDLLLAHDTLTIGSGPFFGMEAHDSEAYYNPFVVDRDLPLFTAYAGQIGISNGAAVGNITTGGNYNSGGCFNVSLTAKIGNCYGFAALGVPSGNVATTRNYGFYSKSSFMADVSGSTSAAYDFTDGFVAISALSETGTTVTATTASCIFTAGTQVYIQGAGGVSGTTLPYNGTWTVVSPCSAGVFTFVPSWAITNITEPSGTTATVTTSVPHGLAAGNTITIAGSTVANYNTTFTVVASLSAFSFTITTGTSANGTGTGGTVTITGLPTLGAGGQVQGVHHAFNFQTSDNSVTMQPYQDSVGWKFKSNAGTLLAQISTAGLTVPVGTLVAPNGNGLQCAGIGGCFLGGGASSFAGIFLNEFTTTGPPGSSQNDVCEGNSTSHTLQCTLNNGPVGTLKISDIEGSIVADSAAINTTDTIIVKTPAIPASRLTVGTVFRIVLDGTCTSTAANVSTFTIRWGTNGTTADGTVAAVATSVAATSGTTNPFHTELLLTVRTIGASATSDVTGELTSQGNIGIVATPNAFFVAGTAFNSTTASAILSVSYKAALTTTTSTFRNAFIELVHQ
jgi:hypothetical protein